MGGPCGSHGDHVNAPYFSTRMFLRQRHQRRWNVNIELGAKQFINDYSKKLSLAETGVQDGQRQER